jgi:hypothetical protein
VFDGKLLYMSKIKEICTVFGLKCILWGNFLIMLDFQRGFWWAVFLAFFLIAGYCLPVFAAPPTVYDFRLTQGVAKLPTLKAYADIIGSGDIPAKGLVKEDLKAKIGATPISVSKVVPFEDSNEGIGYVLLIDVSKSLSNEQFSQMKETLAAFVDAMSERDQAALVTFGSDVKIIQDFSSNRAGTKEKLATLKPSDEETAFYSGLDKAITVAKSGGAEVPSRRVVITLTDGINDLAGGISKGDITAKIANDPIPMYLIGYAQGNPTAEEESAIGVMKMFAGQSGGRFYDGRGGGWRGIYFAITRSIRSAFVIEMEAEGFRSEGATYPLEVTLTAVNRTWNSKLQLSVPAGGTIPAPTAPTVKDQGLSYTGGILRENTWVYAGIVVGVIGAIGIGWFWMRKRASRTLGSAATPNAAAALRQSANAIANLPETPGVLVRLTQLHGGRPYSQFELEIVDRVVLGRDPAVSQLVFEDDTYISPAHCEIVFDMGLLYVQDLGSMQGTFVNEMRLLERQRIDEKDILKIGHTEMQVSFPD